MGEGGGKCRGGSVSGGECIRAGSGGATSVGVRRLGGGSTSDAGDTGDARGRLPNWPVILLATTGSFATDARPEEDSGGGVEDGGGDR